MKFFHESVLLDEVIKSLDVQSGGIYLDCTLGGGGHSLEIGRRLGSQGTLIGIDQDDAAITAATERLSELSCKVRLVRENFSRLESILDSLGVDEVDGVLFDLGISSPQIDTPERGFSYMADAPLDMRMDRRRNFTAANIVNGYSEGELVKIFSEYGEEKFSKRIATAIVRAAKVSPIETTGELVSLIERSIPHTKGGGHPAKRVFQAIRIEVNGELKILEHSLTAAVSRLKVGGRIAVISFHSLEDRIVKTTFKRLAQDCTCPKNFPVCVCGHRAQIRLLGKAVVPSTSELEVNSRAKSAKLRVAQKI